MTTFKEILTEAAPKKMTKAAIKKILQRLPDFLKFSKGKYYFARHMHGDIRMPQDEDNFNRMIDELVKAEFSREGYDIDMYVDTDRSNKDSGILKSTMEIYNVVPK